MSTENKPSAAAMRAAEKIFPNAVAGQIRNTAEIIDAELASESLERNALVEALKLIDINIEKGLPGTARLIAQEALKASGETA